jgi:cytochrome bd-type quinol oxidase subunit 1
LGACFRAAGGVIGQTLAMEGVFSFFLESTFLGLLLYGEKRLSRAMHWFAAVCVFAGSWLSGYFIIATDAWMQHPVGYTLDDRRHRRGRPFPTGQLRATAAESVGHVAVRA